jgi:phosphopantothenoylcysteine decarboxylase/phosphopantothenate--cysteine ligase
MSKANIVLCVTGSIAAFKAAALASRLAKSKCNVQVVQTTGSKHFIGEATFEGLTGKPVLSDMFHKGTAMQHVDLVRWADVFVVYPCSANMIAKLSSGTSDDLTSCVFVANNFEKPFWIAPAMNTNMLEHPAVMKNLKTLSKWGCKVFSTGEGRLACGSKGLGRLAEPQYISAQIERMFL